MDQLQARKLLFLGDLIHGRIENQTNLNHLVDKWRQRHKNVELFLATGNHDLRSGDHPNQFRFDYVATEIILGPFIFTHKPRRNSSFYGFAGHLHPAVAITGIGGLKETLPCFCFGLQAALLPAFGSFTGNQVIRPTSDDWIYVVADDEVVEM
jgi:DNA ligase-associated metallophosphoesterase